MADLPYKLSDAPPAVQPPLEKWSHEAVMKWFNSLPENDKKKFGAFFNDSKRFPLEAEGKDLARMKEERFVALLGDVLGASLYEELQPLKAKAASSPPLAQLSAPNSVLEQLLPRLNNFLERKEKKRSHISISKPPSDGTWEELCHQFAITFRRSVDDDAVDAPVDFPFAWQPKVPEPDHPYLEFLSNQLSLDKNRVCWYNGNASKDLLSIPGFRHFAITGTTDAAIIDWTNYACQAFADGIVILFEVKKEVTAADHRQAVLELLGADYKSSHKPIAVLTDLNAMWFLLWIEKAANGAGFVICERRVSQATAFAFIRTQCAMIAPRREETNTASTARQARSNSTASPKSQRGRSPGARGRSASSASAVEPASAVPSASATSVSAAHSKLPFRT